MATATQQATAQQSDPAKQPPPQQPDASERIDPENEASTDPDPDLDSAYASSLATETTSLRSAVTDYIYSNGRRYNAFRPESYWGPNDERAASAVDITHHVYTLTLDGELFLAPIDPDPQRVLDLGTGTGTWAIEFADLYPSAVVTGTDLSPIQPVWVPPNVRFEVDDFESQWTFKSGFDFVHARGVYGCVADYGLLYERVLESLREGGWYEQVEASVEPMSDDGSIQGTVMADWGKVSLEAGEKFGKSLNIVHETEERMKKAGFVNVKYEKRIWPIGGWPKDERLKLIGKYNRLAWDEGMEGWTMFLFTKYLGVS